MVYTPTEEERNIMKQAGQIRAKIRYHKHVPTEDEKSVMKRSGQIQSKMRTKKPTRPKDYYKKIGSLGGTKTWSNPKMRERTELFKEYGRKGAEKRWGKKKKEE